MSPVSEFSPPVASDADLDDLRRRLAATRAPRVTGGDGWERGTETGYLAGLVRSWRDDYDWRTHEARITDLPWAISSSGELRFLHQRSSNPDAPVVVLLHGWPDSVLRFERVLPLLTDLNVVVPALPGFPFAAPAELSRINTRVIASAVADAMDDLGYDRYVISAGDVGGDVAEHLAAAHSDRVTALHLTNISPLHAVFADRSVLTAAELAYLERVALWQRTEGGYIAEQSSKPHTLAAGLSDSPAGLAAWIVEKLRTWSDTDGDFEEVFPLDDLLTWLSAYWFDNTIGASFATYAAFVPPVPYVATPTVVSSFAHDSKPAPREFAARFVNVQHWIEHDAGGHFAAWEQPGLYAGDLRQAIGLTAE